VLAPYNSPVARMLRNDGYAVVLDDAPHSVANSQTQSGMQLARSSCCAGGAYPSPGGNKEGRKY
jgi:hypothetical protein